MKNFSMNWIQIFISSCLFDKSFFQKIPILNKLSILYGVRTFVLEENCPPVMVRVWYRVRLRKRFGEQFSSGAIVLEPFYAWTRNPVYYKRLPVSEEGVQRCFISRFSGEFEKTSTEESSVKELKKKKKDSATNLFCRFFSNYLEQKYRTLVNYFKLLLNLQTVVTNQNWFSGSVIWFDWKEVS